MPEAQGKLERPAAFATRPGSGETLWILKPTQADLLSILGKATELAKRDPDATDFDQLVNAMRRGEWQQVDESRARIVEHDGVKAIPLLIGAMDADNSHRANLLAGLSRPRAIDRRRVQPVP